MSEELIVGILEVSADQGDRVTAGGAPTNALCGPPGPRVSTRVHNVLLTCGRVSLCTALRPLGLPACAIPLALGAGGFPVRFRAEALRSLTLHRVAMRVTVHTCTHPYNW